MICAVVGMADSALIVADAATSGADLLPIVTDISSRVQSIDTACWVVAATFVAFAFAYWVMRWF